MKEFLIISIIFFYFISCTSKLSDGVIKTADNFFTGRATGNYFLMYDICTESFKKRLSYKYFEYLEKVYFDKLGKILKYKIYRWNYIKNVQFGAKAGKMVYIVFECEYEKGITEESITFLNIENDIWRIFDYNIKVKSIK